MKKKILLVYLGKRGGGARLLGETVTLLLERDVPFVALISSSLDEATKMLCPRKLRFEISTFTNLAKAVVRTTFLPLRLFSIFFFLRKNNVFKAYFLMPHIWDLPLLLFFKFLGISVEVLIHDPKPHMGEFFPPKVLMTLEAKLASRTIVLSEYSRGLMSSKSKNMTLKHLPTPPRLMPPPEKEYEILFIGRAQIYKGLDLLLEAMTLPQAQGLKLTVISSFSGETPESTDNVQVIDRWIHESDFEKTIASARIVVLPYREASQSGIIPIAFANRIPCVVTPVGALPEMIEHYGCGLVSKSIDPSDILETIIATLNSHEFSFVNESVVQTVDAYISENDKNRVHG
jgi:glycosyltransferase involved in cell wall biosynthesis